MKKAIDIKVFLSFVCISIWLFAGGSTVLWAQSDKPPAGPNNQQRPIEKPVFVPGPPQRGNVGNQAVAPKPSGEAANEQKSAEAEDGGKKEDADRFVTIDFEEVDINLFIKYISTSISTIENIDHRTIWYTDGSIK